MLFITNKSKFVPNQKHNLDPDTEQYLYPLATFISSFATADLAPVPFFKCVYLCFPPLI